jgi:hypothetical protein
MTYNFLENVNRQIQESQGPLGLVGHLGNMLSSVQGVGHERRWTGLKVFDRRFQAVIARGIMFWSE